MESGFSTTETSEKTIKVRIYYNGDSSFLGGNSDPNSTCNFYPKLLCTRL